MVVNVLDRKRSTSIQPEAYYLMYVRRIMQNEV